MEDWLDSFDLRLGLDGFWFLYEDNVEVFSTHDESFPEGLDEEERLLYAINMWDAQDEEITL